EGGADDENGALVAARERRVVERDGVRERARIHRAILTLSRVRGASMADAAREPVEVGTARPRLCAGVVGRVERGARAAVGEEVAVIGGAVGDLAVLHDEPAAAVGLQAVPGAGPAAQAGARGLLVCPRL